MEGHGLTGYSAVERPSGGSRRGPRHRASPAPAVDTPPELGTFPTNFGAVVKNNPPPMPPQLARTVAAPRTKQYAAKVKAMLRICPVDSNYSSFLSCDASKNQVIVNSPAGLGHLSHLRTGGGAPKIFTFDAVFSQDSSLAEVCSTSLVEVLQAVVNGLDGCICCYGHARLGKTYTMLGVDDTAQNLGIVPCAISWLFKLIGDLREKSGSRFSVRVSAVEVTGKQETQKDLLANVGGSLETGSVCVQLQEDLVRGSNLESWSEIRAPTAEHAAYCLDAAVAARTLPGIEDDSRNSHLLFTLHIYQYSVERSKDGPHEVIGGHTRLHLLDFGSGSRDRGGGGGATCVSLSALGSVLHAIASGKRCLPHQSSKLTHLLREVMGGSAPCFMCMIIHVSPAMKAYNETLQMIQLASRFHRIDFRRKSKMCGSSSDDSSTDGRTRIHSRLNSNSQVGTEDGYSLSDPDYTSSSEQSCDTVIYVGKNGRSLSDRDLTDNERPPREILMRNSDHDRISDNLKMRIGCSKADCVKNSNSSSLRAVDVEKVVSVSSVEAKEVVPDDVRYCPTGGEVRPIFEECRIMSDIPKIDHSQEISGLKVTDRQGVGLTVSARLRRLKHARHKGSEKVFEKAEEMWIDGPIVTMLPANQSGNDEAFSKAANDLQEEQFPIRSSGVSHNSPGIRKTKQNKHPEIFEKELPKCPKPSMNVAKDKTLMPSLENDVASVDVNDHFSSVPSRFSPSTRWNLDAKKIKKSPKHSSPSSRDHHLTCSVKHHQPLNTSTTAAVGCGSDLPGASVRPGADANSNSCLSVRDPVVLSGDRTAQWVRSVQDVATSKYVHLLHARKQLFRSIHQKQGKEKGSSTANDRIPNANTIAVFDRPLAFPDNDSEHDGGNNSPPPDYASCMAGSQCSVLDINENKADVSFDDENPVQDDEPPSFCSNSNQNRRRFSVTERTGERTARAARLCTPDGASNPNLSETAMPLSPSLRDRSTDGEFHDTASISDYDLSSQDNLCSIVSVAAADSNPLSEFHDSSNHPLSESLVLDRCPAAVASKENGSLTENPDATVSGSASSLPSKRKPAKRDHFFGMSLFSCVSASSCHVLPRFGFKSSSRKNSKNTIAQHRGDVNDVLCANRSNSDNLLPQDFPASGSQSQNSFDPNDLDADNRSDKFGDSSGQLSMHGHPKDRNFCETSSVVSPDLCDQCSVGSDQSFYQPNYDDATSHNCDSENYGGDLVYSGNQPNICSESSQNVLCKQKTSVEKEEVEEEEEEFCNVCFMVTA